MPNNGFRIPFYKNSDEMHDYIRELNELELTRRSIVDRYLNIQNKKEDENILNWCNSSNDINKKDIINEPVQYTKHVDIYNSAMVCNIIDNALRDMEFGEHKPFIVVTDNPELRSIILTAMSKYELDKNIEI